MQSGLPGNWKYKEMPCLSRLQLGLSAANILDTNPLIPRNLSHESLGRANCCKAFSSGGGGDQAAIDTAAFTAMAIKTVLKKNETMPCQSTVRRIAVLFTTTSETWQVMPTTNEK